MWLAVCTIFMLLLVAEAAREAFFSKSWEARHYPRVQIDPELLWWAHRKSRREKREQEIDLPQPQR